MTSDGLSHQVRFDAFVAEGKVLNNYASVLAMLLQVLPL